MKINKINKIIAVLILGVLIYRGYQKTNSFTDAIAGILFVLNFLFSLIFIFPIIKNIILHTPYKPAYKEYAMLFGIPIILNIGILICKDFTYLKLSLGITVFFVLFYSVLIKFFKA
jgi:hypothetical protein